MKARQKRTLLVFGGLAGVAVIAALVVVVLQNQVFFYSPSDVVADKAPQGSLFRMGGLVEVGSVEREDDGLTVHFNVTDNAQVVPVTYTGILPDLFSEGQGVVTQGTLDSSGRFTASEVLAKHDETYMPPEVAEALEMAKGGDGGQQPMPGTSSLVQ